MREANSRKLEERARQASLLRTRNALQQSLPPPQQLLLLLLPLLLPLMLGSLPGVSGLGNGSHYNVRPYRQIGAIVGQWQCGRVDDVSAHRRMIYLWLEMSCARRLIEMQSGL